MQRDRQGAAVLGWSAAGIAVLLVMLVGGRLVEELRADIVVIRDRNCQCCLLWARYLRDAGWVVAVRDTPDLDRERRSAGVPRHLAACHTALVDDFVIEGHVPVEHIARLLLDRPPGVRGLAVPGMPVGSPGMEQGDRHENFDVIAFTPDGAAWVFSRHDEH